MKPGLFGQLDGANPHLALLCDISGSHSSDAANSSLPGCLLRRIQRQSSTDASNGRTAFIFRATEATDLVQALKRQCVMPYVFGSLWSVAI